MPDVQLNTQTVCPSSHKVFTTPHRPPRRAQAIYYLTKHFLTEYAGSGKVFMLGNWEGDW